MPYKVKKRSHKRRNGILSAALVVLIVVGVVGFVWHRHDVAQKNAAAAAAASVKPENTVDYSAAPAADNAANDARKGNDAAASTLDNGSTNSTTAPFSVQIVSVNPSSSNVHIGTAVSGTTNGTCTLTASKSGQTTLQLASSSVVQDVNAYDCGVFNVPPSKFVGGGTWKLTLTVSQNGSQASDSANVTI